MTRIAPKTNFISWSPVFSLVGIYLHQVTCKVTLYYTIFNTSVNIHILESYIILLIYSLPVKY